MARFTVDIPNSLDTWLAAQAEQAHRSKNGHICYLLSQARRRTGVQIDIFTDCSGSCDDYTHYFRLATPMEGDECNCGKVRW